MKAKILFSATILMTLAFVARASEETSPAGGDIYGNSPQQMVVSNYNSSYGFEYSSRIKRFHNSYVSFDFYSPVYTEVYYYNYAPNTWGISIYDPWYSYANYGPAYNTWGGGFGGSYWWGFEPWWGYTSVTSFGWNSWSSPGITFGVNIHTGNAYYNYPIHYNRWYSGNYCNCCYSTGNGGNNYYPSQPYYGGSRSRYTVTNGRSSGSQTTSTASGSGRTLGGYSGSTQVTGNNTGTTGNNGNNGNQGNNGNAADNDKEKSNNGLRMGQYRRGVAEPTAPKPNEPVRTNNPNVNDRTNPGRGNNNQAKPKDSGNSVQPGYSAPAGRTLSNGATTGTRSSQSNQGSVSSTSASSSRQQTQSSVKTASGSRETAKPQVNAGSEPQSKDSSVQKSSRKSSSKSSETRSTEKENSEKKTTSSGRR